MFEVFNSPAPDFSCERRENSTVTPQVFTLWNSPLSMNRALALAISVQDGNVTRQDAVAECFRRLFSREPTERETALCIQAWSETEAALTEQELADARRGTAPPLEVVRQAVEENTGERFQFSESLYASRDFVPDHNPDDINNATVALADVCLTLMNSNEFAYLD